ncbi:MAG: OmpA family protein [Thiobacillus sp.]|nr:OmpA family protein [Thiobacillus sp.]
MLDTPCPVPPEKTPVIEPVVESPPAAVAPEPVALAPVAAPAPPPAPAPAPAPTRLVLDDVNFDFDKASLRPQAYPKLDAAAESLKAWGDGKVEVAGHTDSRGSEAYNMGLSLRRAESVRDYLVTKGIPSDRLVIKGYGESQPVADNATDEGRFQNRRVELHPIK